MMTTHRSRRLFRAYIRDTWVLVRQFRHTLIIFVLLLTIGTVILRLTYSPTDPMRWGVAFHTVFKLMFFETLEAYPEHILAQMVYLLWPILGIVLVVNGVVQFGTALFNRQERKEAWQVAVASTYHDHIIVCGLGKVGYRVVLQLLKMQQDIVGIELDPEAPFLRRIHDEGIPVLSGDARDRDMLENAQVADASAIVACTEDDLTNLEVALAARDLNPGIKVVMRMFDQQLAERVSQGFGIRTAFSTSALSAPAFAAAATRAAVEHSLYVDGVLLNVGRTTVARNSPLAGRTVGDVERELDLSIILHQGAEGVDLHPAADIVLREGEQIVVFATLESLAALNVMNRGEEAWPPKSSARSWLERILHKRPGRQTTDR